MDSYTQLLIIFISFTYGILFYLLAKYNLWMIKNLNTFLKYLFTLLFIVDIVIIYIYIIYKINQGIFHIYFLISLFLGYLLMSYFFPKFANYINKLITKFKKNSKVLSKKEK